MVAKTEYQICIFAKENNPHSACFIEVAKLLKYSLQSLGFACELGINKLAAERTNILLGSNILHSSTFSISDDYIIYQLEQLSENEGWYSDSMKHILKNASAVWDYSQQNIAFLTSKGINAKYLPLGYHQTLDKIPHNVPKDINMLFYGSINERRQKILNALRKSKNSKLHIIYGIYGNDRDALIARSKIILNIHFYQTNIFEAVRISYLLNNRCFIISEESSVYPYPGVDLCLVPYDKIVETCLYYSEHPKEVDEKSELTYRQFRKLYSMEKLLTKVFQKK